MVDLKNINFKNNNLNSIKGDASFRNFYRKKSKIGTSIIVYSKKEKKKNLLNYTAINKILLKKKISAPKLLSQNYKNNYIEIEDLGKITLYKILNRKNKKKIFNKVLKILIKLQKIRLKKIRNFDSKYYKIPIYSKKILFEESNLFLKWYLPSIHKGKKKLKINKDLTKIIKKLIKKLKFPNDTFVHRDFHVSNLMMNKNKISIIDSQDAVYGNIAYDLASLIDDVRIKTSKKFKRFIYNNYFDFNKKKIK